MTRPSFGTTERRRSREWPEVPAARVTAAVAFGWSLISLAEVVIFAVAIAPTVGDSIPFHISGRSASGFDFDVATGFALWSGLVITVGATLLSLVGMLLTRRMLRTAFLSAALISVLVPLLATRLLMVSHRVLVTPGDADPGLAANFIPVVAALLGLASVLVVLRAFKRPGKHFSR